MAASDKTVTVDQMDYKYIDKCSNGKELERILRALRSGCEGYYPDLIAHCEKKLTAVNPDSRSLRKSQPLLGPRDLKQEELSKLDDSLHTWEREMSELNSESSGDNWTKVNGHVDQSDLPPIRSSQSLKGSVKENVQVSNAGNSGSKRIKSYDYKAWDKFDIDSECSKIDQEPEANTQNSGKNVKKTLPGKLDVTKLSENEKQIRASAEKDKGNEAFKAGDFEEALVYYSRSISLLPSAPSYNNRALAYLRLEKWQKAKGDCNKVLSVKGEEGNLKAKLRRATAHKALKELQEAKSDIEFVLEKEPNNARAKSILKDIKKLEEEEMKIGPHESSIQEEEVKSGKFGKTMVITEVDGDSDEEEEESGDQKPRGESLVETSPTSKEKVTDEDSQNDAVVQQKDEGDEDSILPIQNAKKFAEITATQPPPVPKFPPKTDKLKSEAAGYFKAGQYGEAGNCYTKAIQSLEDFLKVDHPEPAYNLALAVLHNNRAACWLKQGNDKACIDDCAFVLELKPWDAKALMRRAVAYEHIEKYDLAFADFKAAESIDWNNAFAQDGANRAASHMRQIHGNKWRQKIPDVPMYSNRSFENMQQVGGVKVKEEDETQPEPEQNRANEASGNSSRIPSQLQPVKTANSEIPPVKSEDKSTKSSKKTPPKGKAPSKQRPQNKQSKIHVKETKSKVKVAGGKKHEEKTKQEMEKDAKKEKIRHDVYERLKLEGNELVKKGEYSAAIECYTRCITVDPKETAGYTNRALCFLKLEKNVSAANDCTEAIKLDPANVKAYYRRAQARKAVNLFADAQKDIRKLLEFDPANKAGKAELVALSKLMQKEDAGGARKKMSPAKDEKTKSKSMVIEEVSSSSSDEGEFILPKHEDVTSSSRMMEEAQTDPGKQDVGNSKEESHMPKSVTNHDSSRHAQLPENDPLTVGDSVSVQNQSTDTKSDPTSHMHSSQTNRKNSSPKKSPSKIKVPKGKQLTPFEFGSLWNSISDKSDFDSYKEILDSTKPQQMPELLSNKIDDHVILMVNKVALSYLKDEGDSRRAFDMMKYLAKSDRFTMAAMFLSDRDKDTLRHTFSELRSEPQKTYTNEELQILMNSYAM